MSQNQHNKKCKERRARHNSNHLYTDLVPDARLYSWSSQILYFILSLNFLPGNGLFSYFFVHLLWQYKLGGFRWMTDSEYDTYGFIPTIFLFLSQSWKVTHLYIRSSFAVPEPSLSWEGKAVRVIMAAGVSWFLWPLLFVFHNPDGFLIFLPIAFASLW